uniref:Venom peptide Htglin beta n=1 Tax=Hadogenes troglodytes TaxID=1577150 RepID=A0A1B3IJ44_9SCOR|nr:venom peptide Htglin beta [Hadogenes troglodytes]
MLSKIIIISCLSMLSTAYNETVPVEIKDGKCLFTWELYERGTTFNTKLCRRYECVSSPNSNVGTMTVIGCDREKTVRKHGIRCRNYYEPGEGFYPYCCRFPVSVCEIK